MKALSPYARTGRAMVAGGFLDSAAESAGEPSPAARRFEVSVFLRHASDIASVDRFALAHGLRMVEADLLRACMILEGTVHQFAQAFRTRFVRRRSARGLCRTLTRPATLPESIAGRVLFVHRLKTFPSAVHPGGQAVAGRAPLRGGAPCHMHATASGPCSPSHRIDVTFLTRSLADMQAVASFLLRWNLAVFRLPCRQLAVRASGTLHEFGRLFDTEFVRHEVRGHSCRDVRRHATLPAPIARRVLFVVGLGSFAPAPADAAVPLPPGGHAPLAGTTLSDSPASAGTVLEDRLIDFEIRGPMKALVFSGRLQDRVVKSGATGKLIFVQRIRDTAAGLPGTVTSIGRGDFSESSLQADYRLDGPGTVGPVRVRRSGAADNGRSCQFLFPPRNAPLSLAAGSESRFCELISGADSYGRVGLTSIVAASASGTARATVPTFSPLHP